MRSQERNHTRTFTSNLPSNENDESAVPDPADTVIVRPVGIRMAAAAKTRHLTVVPLVQEDVAQSTDAKVAVGVRSVAAKARPLSVAVAPPVVGAFPTPTWAELSTGAGENPHADHVAYRRVYGPGQGTAATALKWRAETVHVAVATTKCSNITKTIEREYETQGSRYSRHRHCPLGN